MATNKPKRKSSLKENMTEFTLITIVIIMIISGITMTWIMTAQLKKRELHRPLTILKLFNEEFIAGNESLTLGNTEGLELGIVHFKKALKFSTFQEDRQLKKAIQHLKKSLACNKVADLGPWGSLFRWKNSLEDRQYHLREAWKPIREINENLKSQGLGWDYKK
ncbi:MAG: hypothetical protein WC087_01745 [Candidatus Paceibacterota bacterium]